MAPAEIEEEFRDSALLEYDEKNDSHRPTAEHDFWVSFFEYDENRKQEFLRRVNRSKSGITPGSRGPKARHVGWIAWDFVDRSFAKRASLFAQYVEALDRVCEVIKSTQEKFEQPILLPQKKYEQKLYYQELLRIVKSVLPERHRKLNSVRSQEFVGPGDEKQKTEAMHVSVLERWRKIEQAISWKLTDLEYKYARREYARDLF